MENLNKPKNKPISSNLNTKTFVVDSLAIGKSSYDISKETGYPASTIRSYHRNNKELVQERRKQLEALAPNILEELKYDTLTSNELSKHLYRPDEYKNDTALTDKKDIIDFKKSLIKQKIRILENIGIFESQALINYNLSQFNDNRNQNAFISDNVLNLLKPHFKELIEPVDTEVVDTDTDTTSDSNSENSENANQTL